MTKVAPFLWVIKLFCRVKGNYGVGSNFCVWHRSVLTVFLKITVWEAQYEYDTVVYYLCFWRFTVRVVSMRKMHRIVSM